MFISSTINELVLYIYLVGLCGLEHPKKEQNLRKSFHKTSFQLDMRLKKEQKQDGDKRMQEDYPTSAVYFLKMLGSLLQLFHLCLVCVLFQPQISNSNEVLWNLFPY